MSSAGPEPDLSVQSFRLKITRGAIVGFMSVFQKFKIILDGHNRNVNRAVNQNHEIGGGGEKKKFQRGQSMFIHDR